MNVFSVLFIYDNKVTQLVRQSNITYNNLLKRCGGELSFNLQITLVVWKMIEKEIINRKIHYHFVELYLRYKVSLGLSLFYLWQYCISNRQYPIVLCNMLHKLQIELRLHCNTTHLDIHMTIHRVNADGLCSCDWNYNRLDWNSNQNSNPLHNKMRNLKLESEKDQIEAWKNTICNEIEKVLKQN